MPIGGSVARNVLATKLDDLSLIFGTHLVERETCFLQVGLWPPDVLLHARHLAMCYPYTPPLSNVNTSIKHFKNLTMKKQRFVTVGKGHLENSLSTESYVVSLDTCPAHVLLTQKGLWTSLLKKGGRNRTLGICVDERVPKYRLANRQVGLRMALRKPRRGTKKSQKGMESHLLCGSTGPPGTHYSFTFTEDTAEPSS